MNVERTSRGFDYLGEPTPYDEYWPSRSSYFGIYDLAGLPKDRVWLYRTHWAPEKETLHILPHWTWKGREGEVTPVFVYTNYPEAELFVNGVSQGRRKRLEMTMDEYLASAHKRKVPWGTENMSDPASAKNRIDRYRLRWISSPRTFTLAGADFDRPGVLTFAWARISSIIFPPV